MINPVSTINLVISLFIIAIFGCLFFWIRFKIKTINKDSLTLEELEDFEKTRDQIRSEIKKKSLSDKIKEINKRFILISFVFILTQCGGRELLIFPEPPARPQLNWVEKDGGAWISEKELTSFLIYDKESEEYRKKQIEFLNKLGKNIGD